VSRDRRAMRAIPSKSIQVRQGLGAEIVADPGLVLGSLKEGHKLRLYHRLRRLRIVMRLLW
jgi:hypothetical protein